jgi:hypothetical protein
LRGSGTKNISKDISEFVDALTNLQKLREDADYDPLTRVYRTDVTNALNLAREAIVLLAAAPEDKRRAYLTAILFKRRDRDN